VPVRPLRAADLPALERFVVMAAFNPCRPLPADAASQPHVRRWLDGWPRDDELGVGWTEDDTLLGGAWARRFGGERERLVAVEPEHRGRGIGGTLLDALADAAATHGELALTLTVGATNPALALYRRHGFADAGADRGGLLVLRRDLTGGR
jgi:GNAT superfamily N-acetyltransferase